MESEHLAEIAKYFEEYLHGDPSSPETQQAGVLFRSMVKQEYESRSEVYRAQITLANFQASELIPVIDAYLKRQQTKFPTPTPERHHP